MEIWFEEAINRKLQLKSLDLKILTNLKFRDDDDITRYNRLLRFILAYDSKLPILLPVSQAKHVKRKVTNDKWITIYFMNILEMNHNIILKFASYSQCICWWTHRSHWRDSFTFIRWCESEVLFHHSSANIYPQGLWDQSIGFRPGGCRIHIWTFWCGQDQRTFGKVPACYKKLLRSVGSVNHKTDIPSSKGFSSGLLENSFFLFFLHILL